MDNATTESKLFKVTLVNEHKLRVNLTLMFYANMWFKDVKENQLLKNNRLVKTETLMVSFPFDMQIFSPWLESQISFWPLL